MAVYMVRAGAHGEYEQKFLQDNRVYLTWPNLRVDLGKLEKREAMIDALKQCYPEEKLKTIQNFAGQIWAFAHGIQKGDIIIQPLKTQPAIRVAEVVGNYHCDKAGENPFLHWLEVEWIAEAVPRTHFGQDLLYSFGAFLTICRVQRNNAEARIAAMRASGWKAETGSSVISVPEEEEKNVDLEELGRDQIAQLISARFKGHDFTRLVEAILKVQGYTTYRSPAGADGGVDILAGAGPLGFGQPRLCVEVKSGDVPADRPTVDKLLGAVTKFGAQEGLFVSWGGFKANVQKELAQSFFRVRLWSQKEFLEALFADYDRLDDDIKAELPLKRIWTVATLEDE